MKKLLLLFVLCSSIAHSQWTYKTVDNGLDEPYPIAYTDLEDGAMLKLENVNGKIVFYLKADYICDEEMTIDMALLISGEYTRYSFTGKTSKDHTCVFFTWDLENSIADDDFQVCSELKVRINDTTCGEQTYNFNMRGSTLALKYMKTH
jgi:hypothetical protein